MSDTERASTTGRNRFLLGVLIVGLSLAAVLPNSADAAQADDPYVATTDLPYMVLPITDFGGDASHLQVDPGSGFSSADDLEPTELAAYSLFYSSDDLYGELVGSAVGIYTDASAASAAITDGFDAYREGVELDGGTLETFDVPGLGDEAIGTDSTFEFDELGFRETFVVFRTGRLLGVLFIFRFDVLDVRDQAVTSAHGLLERMHGVLNGDVTTLPAVLPPDLNCDGRVDALDAALLLQLNAALLDSLPCDFLADANGDGRADVVDAALILQFDAGLIYRFTGDTASRHSGEALHGSGLLPLADVVGSVTKDPAWSRLPAARSAANEDGSAR